MAAPKNLSPEKIAAIRQDYANGVPVAQIMAGHEITRGTLYYIIGWTAGPRRGRGTCRRCRGAAAGRAGARVQ